jgi:peptidyl-dipeptidase Dcp
MEELAALTTRFAQNVLHDESSWQLALQTESDLDGLPDFVRAAARQAASQRGLPGHVITLSRSLVVPFLTFSTRRDLRETAWRAWTSRGAHPGEHDNREVARDILRPAQRASAPARPHLLCGPRPGRHHGRNTCQRARVAGRSLARALRAVERERSALVEQMQAEGQYEELRGEIEPWDWRFWAEKVRRTRYAIDDAEVKPYFELNRVVQAAFDCAQRLFGLSFTPRDDIPVYHPDVKAFEVRNAQGEVTGIFCQDNFARPNKRSGAG